MVKSLIQKQIWNEYKYTEFLDCLTTKTDCNEVQIIPFSNILNPEQDIIPDLIFGSTRFINIARERNWPIYPSFDPLDFSLFPIEKWYNGDGWESTIGNLNFKNNEFIFIKPYTEKIFNAGIISKDSCITNQIQTTKTLNELDLERVWCAPPKPILNKEIRLFIVDGQIITGSIYKHNGVVKYQNIDNDLHLTAKIQEFLNPIPNLTTVLDVVIDNFTEDIKIVELNNLNSSGFYDINYEKLIDSLINSLQKV